MSENELTYHVSYEGNSLTFEILVGRWTLRAWHFKPDAAQMRWSRLRWSKGRKSTFANVFCLHVSNEYHGYKPLHVWTTVDECFGIGQYPADGGHNGDTITVSRTEFDCFLGALADAFEKWANGQDDVRSKILALTDMLLADNK